MSDNCRHGICVNDYCEICSMPSSQIYFMELNIMNEKKYYYISYHWRHLDTAGFRGVVTDRHPLKWREEYNFNKDTFDQNVIVISWNEISEEDFNTYQFKML